MTQRPMTQRPITQRPGMTPQAEADRHARLEREAQALRENLRRRKAQVRARAAPESHEKLKTEPDAAPD